MIDIQILRDDPELVKRKSAEKQIDVEIDKALMLDEVYRKSLQTVEQLRKDKNDISAQMKDGKPDQDLIDKGKQIKLELAEREELLGNTKSELNNLIDKIPNLHFDDVPIGDESAGEEISRWGDCESTGASDHLELALQKDWVDFERGAKVAGAKFYYLKGDLALLENAIIQYGLEVIQKEKFLFMNVPNMVNSRIATGTGFAPRSDNQSDEYFIEGEDLSLIATSEIPLTGYHADEIIDEKDTPKLYAGYSPCYRKEAGTYGKHARGLFRVHQFYKLEMYAFCTKEDSAGIHEKMLAIEEAIWQEIGIPYRVLNIASGDLGAPAAKKFDVEYWSKVDGNFRELTSCSNCTDFQTRNLNIRVRREDGSVELLHSLNGTAVSTARTLVAIMERFQNEDGSLQVPEVLQKYMGGRKVI